MARKPLLRAALVALAAPSQRLSLRAAPHVTRAVLLTSQIRLLSTQQSSTISVSTRKRTPPSFASRHQNAGHRGGSDAVVSQVQQLLTRASASRDFEPDLDFLRQAATLLQSTQSRDQLRAALPLCKIVERAATVHSSASAECVRIYEELGRHRDAVELVLRLLRHDFFLMNTVLSSALQSCAALKDVDRGFQIYDLAVQRGTVPNRNVFGALLALSAAAGDAPSSPRVVKLLGQMDQHQGVEMNHSTFHHWMSSYAKAGDYAHVTELFETSEEVYGLQPAEATYAILMDACAENGDYDRTMALLDELKKKKKTEGGEEPQATLVHYNVALKACGKASKLTQAFHLYEEMKDRAIAPDRVTYITMMHAVYHGELGVVDSKQVKLAMSGVGALALATVPFLDLQEHYLTVLFCSSMVGSMGLAVYMNPDGAMRALYPNSDEPTNDTVIEAFFRRLREEDHCGRSMYLWREMIKLGVAPDSRVYDVLVRTCVKKRHPELAFEAVFEQQNVPLVDAESGNFVLSLNTTVSLLQSLLSQRRTVMADTVFDQARAQRAFKDLFRETKDVYTYDLRAFNAAQTRSYAVRRVLTQLHSESKLFGSGKNTQNLPRVEFLVLHGYDLLDQIDMDDPQMRALFSMDEMKRETTASARDAGHATSTTGAHDSSSHAQYFFRLIVPRERLAAFFKAPLASTTEHTL